MNFVPIKKTKIVIEVSKAVLAAKKEIRATMLMGEEIKNPLPKNYHSLLKKKLVEGIVLKRLGFGERDEYNTLKSRLQFTHDYRFRYSADVNSYQRMIIIDRNAVYFSIDGLFYCSNQKEIIAAFIQIFEKAFEKGKNG